MWITCINKGLNGVFSKVNQHLFYQCFVGFKYAAINATVGATIAEFIGSDQGLGFYIQIVTGNMRPDLAFAGIFFLTVLGLAIFGCVTLAERMLIPWHISVRRGAK